MKRNYTCFFKCPGGEAECPGGGKYSRCLRHFDPEAHGIGCAVATDVPKHVKDDPPLWQRAAWDPKVKAAAEKEQERQTRAERRAAASTAPPSGTFKDIPLSEA
jgi:hypothetical protein